MKYPVFFYGGLFCFFLLFSSCSSKEDVADTQKPNVLFICVDDLRPELGCYGKDYIHSPNLDNFAQKGILFKKHFVSVPTCGASRHSLLTGRLPQSLDDIKNSASVKALTGKPEGELPETFIHQLRRNGYYTVGIGKITHHPDGRVYGYTEPVSDKWELPHSWDEMLLDSKKWGSGHNSFFGYADGSNRNTLKGQVKPYEKAEVGDEGYIDGIIAQQAIGKLQELKGKGQPFFLGLGFFKPHLPFTAPAKYWDLYEREDIPLTPNNYLPKNVHRSSLQTMGEFNNYKLGEEKATLDSALSDEYSRKLGHAYAACVSYIDAQIGKVLKELDDLGLAENTIVVVWGDHGWHLGDHRVWGKHTLMDRAVHSTLMMHVPNKGGKQIEKVVGTVDIYPTLMELCAIPMPYETKGRSLLPLIENPASENWEEAAYSYYKGGLSLRTAQYRLNKYYRKEKPVLELFDQLNDPNGTENVIEMHPEVEAELMPLLEKGYTGVYGE
ncbi:sulfatase [Flammeovirgaceae bacterium SG7u.111]|nr:sulfatase [Flammeovirgaceae bacterium SG7u.132]WPO38553.1 sulfatase [Flammeovirgaceae bacterium SG7u.111]